jgi:hypothetical protein
MCTLLADAEMRLAGYAVKTKSALCTTQQGWPVLQLRNAEFSSELKPTGR